LSRPYTSLEQVASDARSGIFSNESELRQAFVEALKGELESTSCNSYVVNTWFKPVLDEAVGRRRPDIRISNLIIEVKRPNAKLDAGREQLKQYMSEFYQQTVRSGIEVYGVVTNGTEAELWEYDGRNFKLLGQGDMPSVVRSALSRLCSSEIPVLETKDLVRLFGLSKAKAGQVSEQASEQAIVFLYKVMEWYSKNKGAGRAGVALNYYKMWGDLHSLTINISEEGWKSIEEFAQRLGLSVADSDERWLFLYAVETYLHLFMRALALSKLGRLKESIEGFYDEISSLREVFAPSVFEWVLEACEDSSLPGDLRSGLSSSITTMLQVLYSLNTTTLTADAFRDLYQNIVPREIRKGLGEFYTKEDVIDGVLEAVGLSSSEAIKDLYRRWKDASALSEKPVILDPACGSGSFLVRVVEKVFDVLGCQPDVAKFLEDVLVGIDVNPFAVEMAKLNLILAIASNMQRRCNNAGYVPKGVRVYWADSLAVHRDRVNVLGNHVVSISVPALGHIIGNGSISVPVLPEVGIHSLIDEAYDCASSSGCDAQRFLKKLEEKVGSDTVDRYKGELLDLHNAVSKITESGNGRIVEFVKNTAVVAELVGRCDYVIGNPPWVRIHGIAGRIVRLLRQHYRYFGEGSGYNPKFKETKTQFDKQHDYSVAFVERGLELLRNGGVLGYVITSKIARAMYAGALREDLVTNYKILEVRDYSLHPKPLFEDAVNYPLIISVKKERPDGTHRVRVVVSNTKGEVKEFEIPQGELPLNRNDKKSPWLLAPFEVISAYRKVASNSSRLGDVYSITRGIETGADDLFVVEEGSTVGVEGWLLQPLVKGGDIRPFGYEVRNRIIFAYDSEFNPLWDPDQKEVLDRLGLLKRNVKVSNAGGAVVYSVDRACDKISNIVKHLSEQGFEVREDVPCSVYSCYQIRKGGRDVLKVKLESQSNDYCKVYVEGLRIPGAPKATKYFLKNLEKLLKRSGYNASLPPWAVFGVSKEEKKFDDYRIAWRDISKRFEACLLPSKDGERIVVPHKTVYFIIEPSKEKAVKLLLYLNSPLVRGLLKLWSWSARGGYYRHMSAYVGHVPLPRQLRTCELWSWVSEEVGQEVNADRLNEIAERIYEERLKDLESELIKSLGITEDEYGKLVGFSKWLNEDQPSEESCTEQIPDPDDFVF
jgi:methylase of polypeptide subunit release factors